MCGVIIRDKEFRRLLAILEHNANKLNNFALLTAASDLLLLRLTLRKKTIPTLLSHVDVERLTLEGMMDKQSGFVGQQVNFAQGYIFHSL